MTEVVGVLSDDMLFEGVALRKPLVAVRTDEVPPSLVNRLHVLLETGRLHHFVAYDAVDVLVRHNHLIVKKPNVAVHVAEVGEHLLAMRALVFGDLKNSIH